MPAKKSRAVKRFRRGPESRDRENMLAIELKALYNSEVMWKKIDRIPCRHDAQLQDMGVYR